MKRAGFRPSTLGRERLLHCDAVRLRFTGANLIIEGSSFACAFSEAMIGIISAISPQHFVGEISVFCAKSDGAEQQGVIMHVVSHGVLLGRDR